MCRQTDSLQDGGLDKGQQADNKTSFSVPAAEWECILRYVPEKQAGCEKGEKHSKGWNAASTVADWVKDGDNILI